MKVADVVVIGLGAMGSASAYQLARRGLKVVALDRFSPPHDQGSSHGATRVTRQAIGEGDIYVPFALRSHEIWREIEAETGEDLLLACGTLVVSTERSTAVHHGKPDFLAQTLAAARDFGIPHEELTASEISARYPQLSLAGDEHGYFEPGGGLLYPEACVGAQIVLARRHGAEIRTDETVVAVMPAGAGVRVVTDRDVYEAGQAVLAAGAWTADIGGPSLASLEIHRQVMFWFEAESPAAYAPERCPVFIWMHGDGPADYFYGFPIAPGQPGVKVATEVYHAALARPELVDRRVSPADAAAMHATHVHGRLTGVTSVCAKSASCFYTVTPDADFVIDHHPETERMLVVSACSGHGFKHSAAIGEAVADLVADGRSRIDLSRFGLARLAERAAGLPPL